MRNLKDRYALSNQAKKQEAITDWLKVVWEKIILE
jgi:hypothetical protein